MKKNETFLAVIFLGLAVLLPYWKLTLMQGFVITDDIFTSDMMNDSFPLRFFIGEAFKSGDLPLWIPHIYGGFPLLARAEAGAAYPLNLVLFGLLPPYTALNIDILLTLIVAAFSAYLLVREIRGSFASGLIAGIAFSFSGYMVSHVKHLANLNSASWLPLGLFFIERSFRRNDPRYLWWLGLISGLQHLAGHTQMAYYSGLMYIAYFAFRYHAHLKETEGRKRLFPTIVSLVRSRFGWMFALAFFLGSGLGAIQILPTYELVSLSQRAGGVTFQYAAQYSYDPSDFLMFLYPYVNGDIGNATYKGNGIFWEDYGYVGATVLLAALYACFGLRRTWHMKCFLLAAAVSFLFVLGPNTPLYEAVFHVVPGMKYFRFPNRFLLITDLALVMLAAIGVTHYEIRRKRKKNGRAASPRMTRFEFLAVVLVTADLWYFQLRQNPIVDADKWLSPPKSVSLLRSTQGEEGLFRIYVVGGNDSHRMTFAAARGWQGDLQPYVDQREFLQASSNVVYDFASPDGYANLTPNYVVEIWGDQNRGGLIYATADLRNNTFVPTHSFWKLMNMYNVKYLLSLWPIAHAGELKELGRIGQAFVYENIHAMARAYLVGGARIARDPEEAKRLLAAGEFDPGREVIVYELSHEYESKDSVAGNVVLKRYTPNRVEFETSVDREALLVFSDTYYPGWKAEIDGNETSILQANITQRAVIVPPGTHTVLFSFKSRPVRWGAYVTGTSLVIFIGFLVIVYGKRKDKGEAINDES